MRVKRAKQSSFKALSLKRDYESAWNMTEEETLEYVIETAHIMAVQYYKNGTVSPVELNGFEIGVQSYAIRLSKGELPDGDMNIRVEAEKYFQHTSSLYPEIDIPQEFYRGYLAGFCYVGGCY